ncbi:MAG TPA: hypothetical protein VJY65_00850 [Chloroflexota bacterium]|nr:hypothetical protein [Chloroflexota bacterium]
MHRRAIDVRLRIINGLAYPRTLVLEPWTTERVLHPGEAVDLLASGDPAYPLEIEVADDRIVVYCFDSEGAVMTVVGEE